jgi:predicted CXXCH cytochrome family protein
MKRLFRIVIMATIFTMAVVYLPPSRIIFAETSTVASCITANCHAQIKKDRYLHGPVAVNDCSVCHKEAGNHKFLPIDVASLCHDCHDKEYSVVHRAAVNAVTCTKCHSPHQSPNKYMLIG